MVARTRKEPDVHVIEFRRDGEEPQRETVVGNGSRVLLHAVGMLIQRRELRLHDRLTVHAAEPDDDAIVEVT
jgi:hypothetical protein